MKDALKKFVRIHYAKLYWKLLKQGGHLSATYTPSNSKTGTHIQDYIVTPL